MGNEYSFENYYDEVAGRMTTCMAAALKSQKSRIGKAHQNIADFHKLLLLIDGRKEFQVLHSLLHDIGLAVYFGISGLYRQSYISQRVFLENAIASIYYSAHPLRLTDWHTGTVDVSWTAVANREDSVFSSDFFRAFAPPAILEHREGLQQAANNLYSDLSDFTHKNVKTRYLDSSHLSAEDGELEKCLETLTRIFEIVSILFCIRYLGEVAPSALEKCSDEIGAAVGHMPELIKRGE